MCTQSTSGYRDFTIERLGEDLLNTAYKVIKLSFNTSNADSYEADKLISDIWE